HPRAAPRRAGRAGPGRRAVRHRGALTGTGAADRRAGRTSARLGRGRGVLRGVRGAGQRVPARGRDAGGRGRPPARRRAAADRHRRRVRRRRPGPRYRTARAAPARRVRGRHAAGREPGRRPDDRRGGAAVRVVIAEDSVLLRDGLSRLFASRDVDVVAAVGDAPALLAAVERHVPDLLVADVRMPPDFTDDGLRAAVEVRHRWPDIGVLVLSQYVEERYATALLAGRTSRIGYLLKDRVADVDEFVA